MNFMNHVKLFLTHSSESEGRKWMFRKVLLPSSKNLRKTQEYIVIES